MDITKAKEIISALADGIDPTTGELLPEDHLCNKAEIVRAFHAILHRDDGKKYIYYENAGKFWTEEDDKLLTELFTKGTKSRELQRRLLRSPGSIEARLFKLGLTDKSEFYRKRKAEGGGKR
jgi:hypothetical protein